MNGFNDNILKVITYIFECCGVKARMSEVITFMTGGMATVKKGTISWASLICSIEAPGVIIDGKNVMPVK